VSVASDLDARVAVVTVASSGLRRHFAQALRTADATVVAPPGRSNRIKTLANEVECVVPVVSDMTGADDLSWLVVEATEVTGRLDRLLNGADGGDAHNALVPTEEDFRASLALDLISVFALATVVAPVMSSGGSGWTVG
jgi:2-deoxy-D-gluconate 3-dehydrogenase